MGDGEIMERHNTDANSFRRYCYLYKKKYPNDGPSISSSCKGKNKTPCGCWTHHLIELEEWNKENVKSKKTFGNEREVKEN